MLSLLRKIKHKIVGEKEDTLLNLTNEVLYHNWTLENQSIDNFSISKNNIFLNLRIKESTDFYVFKQVFIQEEYKTVRDYFIDNEIAFKIVIDAGANIGCTSLYFIESFPDANYFLIEPDEKNYLCLAKNLSHSSVRNYTLYQNALHTDNDVSMFVSEDFRGGGDWAKKTNISSAETNLKSINIETILKTNSIDIIDLLKIDIEGAERFIFEDESKCTFLNQTRVLALEIHDEFKIRKDIYRILKEFSFKILNVGETTIAINKKLV